MYRSLFPKYTNIHDKHAKTVLPLVNFEISNNNSENKV